MKIAMRPTDHEAGFTLIELLVSLSLLALMATYALTTIQRFSDLRRLETITSESERLQRTERHLRQMFAGMRLTQFPGTGGQSSFMQIGIDQLQIANVLDDKLVPGGLYYLKYKADGEVLALTYREPVALEDQNTDKIRLLNGVRSLRYAFINKSGTDKPVVWQDSWDRNDAPAAVALYFEATDPAKTIPPLYIAVETSLGTN